MFSARRIVVPLLAAAIAAAGLSGASPAAAAGPFYNEVTDGISVNGTYTPIVGDFAYTRPGYDDIIWYAPGAGVEQVWVNADTTFAKQPLNQQVNGTYTPIAGRFSGDSYDDIFWYGPGGAADNFWKNTGSHTFQSLPVNISGTYTPFVIPNPEGSYDTILWWKSGGASSTWQFTGTGTGHLTQNFTAPAGARPLIGDFDANGYGDIFWYAPGAGADSLWRGSVGGTFTKTPQTVSGTFTPVVGEFTPNQTGGRDDILWHRGTDTSVLWQSNGNGTWATSPHEIPSGTPVTIDGAQWGTVLIVRPGTDYVWYKNEGAGQYLEPSGNGDVGSTHRPLAGSFKVFRRAEVFFYLPGAGVERLFWSPFSLA